MGQASIRLLVGNGRVGAKVTYKHEGSDTRNGEHEVEGSHAEIVTRYLKQPGRFYDPRVRKRFGVFPGDWAWLLTRLLLLSRREPFVGIEHTPPRLAKAKPSRTDDKMRAY